MKPTIFKESIARVKNPKKVRFFVITLPILVLQAKFEHPWNSCKILDQMSPTEVPNSKKKITGMQKNFVIEDTTKQGCLCNSCKFRSHLLSEIHTFRTIWFFNSSFWLVNKFSSRLLEHCQFQPPPRQIWSLKTLIDY